MTQEAQERDGVPQKNVFDRMEWAGAFGDLGTLLPFIVAYVAVLKVDPSGVLFAFGTAMIACGFFYKTPFPVQPMKAIGAVAVTQAAQTALITPSIVYASGIVTGLLWLTLGLTGMADRIARLVPRPVVIGIVLGLGMSFMLEGIRFMATEWVVGAVGLASALLLMKNRRVPVMFLLLLGGAVYGALSNPQALQALSSVTLDFRLPTIQLWTLTWNDFLLGAVFLALPQMPLTLGNAIIAIREENNRLFPHRPVTEKKIAISTGALNLFGGSVGGVPMCHGAGGMAGHVAFGARTGGAPIILGTILLAIALGFSDSVQALFGLFPQALLGVFLFLTGSQLALGSCDFSRDKGERFTILVTAAFAIWNVGIAFLIGIAAIQANKRGWLRI